MSFTYDSLSRVLTETQGSNPLGSTGKTVTYTYDDDGNRTKLDYPSGFDANETRDALGRLTEVKDASNVSIAAFDLYGGGLRRKKTSFGNGTTSELVYDGFRRPVEINHKTSGGSEFADSGVSPAFRTFLGSCPPPRSGVRGRLVGAPSRGRHGLRRRG